MAKPQRDAFDRAIAWAAMSGVTRDEALTVKLAVGVA